MILLTQLYLLHLVKKDYFNVLFYFYVYKIIANNRNKIIMFILTKISFDNMIKNW